MGREVLNVLSLLDGAREAFGIGAAVPWFDATEGGIDGGPEAEKGSIERDLEEGLTLLDRLETQDQAEVEAEPASVQQQLPQWQSALGEISMLL